MVDRNPPPDVTPEESPEQPLWRQPWAWLAALVLLCLVGVLIAYQVGWDVERAEEAGVIEEAPAEAEVPGAEEAAEVQEGMEAALEGEPQEVGEIGPGEVAAVGERVERSGIAVTVNEVSTAEQIDDDAIAEEGITYLVLDVTIENVGHEEGVPYDRRYFIVEDAENVEYMSAEVAPEPALTSGELAQGEAVRGNVAFEIPSGVFDLVAVYEPTVLLDDYQLIRVDLGG
ncbi:MAG: DUF4352 domain-containing protein [Chloroflexota bacterium]|nr:DUF4352 domain-containing protein [Chloroflexota bacterium]